jgi:xenotropic and polytropic retrovirus receptor 1
MLLGLFMWINFSWVDSMFLYYPVLLIFVTVVILFLPLKVFYYHSRVWWAFSNVSCNISLFFAMAN